MQRILPLLLVGTLFTGLAPAGNHAQELPLKRDVPAVAWTGCPDAPAIPDVGPAQRLEAERLAAEATQASILGNGRDAADLLARAADMDPRSASILHRLARAEDDLGRTDSALAAYCRYLAIASESPDAEDVRARIDALARPAGFAVAAAAVDAFRSGLAHYDAAGMEAAETSFSWAADAAPGWADPIYNRGLVRLALDRREEAADDLRRYLEINPASADFNRVLDVLGTLRGVTPVPYSPASALAAGLLMPGLGHFTTDRAGTGLAFLGAAASAVAAGFAIQRVKVRCLAPPEDGVCPPDDVLRQDTERPYLVPGIAAAVAIGIWGAIDAYRGAQHRNERALELLRVGTVWGGDAVLVALPHHIRGGGHTHVELLTLRF
jgi:tetratricopeptide (TPR) repeat protein